MLILSRTAGEKILITVPASESPTVIEVYVCEIRKVNARLGITAPKAVTVHREEIQKRIDRETAG